ncbi:MAG: phospholipase [Chlorobi bacterium]|nr:phospholipase [Chlorobiota bacterium]
MKKKIALALGSGGARGIAHIGVIRELEDNGFEITSVAGSSMGALIGGVYAAGKLDEYEQWLTSLSKMDIFNLVDFTISSKGIIKVDKVLKEIQSFIPDQKIEELPLSFVAVATDLAQKEEVVIRNGCLYDAIKASISIPMLITPVQKNDTIFVDGGVLNPVPVNRVERNGDDMLVAVNVNAFIPFEHKQGNEDRDDWSWFEKLNKLKLNGFQKQFLGIGNGNGNGSKNKKSEFGYFNLLTKTSSLMLRQIMDLTFKLTPPDVLIEISRDSGGIFDFYKAKELIELGREAARKAIREAEVEAD